MLPEHLSSSYDKYKKDTNFFLDWLHRNAITCGYRYNPPTNNHASSVQPKAARLKGRARKEAKLLATKVASVAAEAPAQPIKHVLPTKEVLFQAETVAKSTNPVVKVPEIVQRLLHEAIYARKRCAAWFQRMKVDGEATEIDDSNEGHGHFITVLESAFKILKPNFECSPSSVDPDSTEDKEAKSGHDTSSDTLGNRFEHLDVEDIDEEAYDQMPSVASSAAAQATHGAMTSSDDIYELEHAADEELAFSIFCFYEDLHKIRQFLRLMWRAVSDGNRDFLSASLTSNVALELVRKSEENLISLAPELFGDDPYRTMTSMIYPVPSMRNPKGEERKQLVESTLNRMFPDGTDNCEAHDDNILPDEFGTPDDEVAGSKIEKESQDEPGIVHKADFVYLSTFYSLEKYANFVTFGKDSTRLPIVPQIGGLYLFNTHLYPNNNTWMYEDELLSQMLLDLEFKSGSEYGMQKVNEARRAGWLPKLTEHHRKVFPFQDEISQGLQHAVLTHKITISAVFEARILVDIVNITNDRVAEFYTDLRQIGATAAETLGITWSTDKKIVKHRGGCVQTREQLASQWIDQDVVGQAVELSFAIRNNIKRNSTVAFKQACSPDTQLEARIPAKPEDDILFETMGIRYESIKLSEDYTFYFNHHPIYCGLERLKLELGLERTGLGFANASFSVVSVAHLYNACQQKGLVQGEWNSLENFIVSNIGQLFRGQLPRSSQQILKRFALCVNVPATVFACENSRGPTPWSRRNLTVNASAKILAQSEISTILGKYFDGSESGEKFLFNVHKFLNKGRASKKPVLTTLEMLLQLSGCLEKAVRHLKTDLITLTRNCSTVLVRIRAAFKEAFGIEHIMDGKDFASYYPPVNVDTVLDILFENERADQHREEHKEVKSRFGEQHLTKLAIAAKVIEDFIQEANTTISVEPFDVVASTCCDGCALPSEKVMKKWDKIMSAVL